MWRPLLARTTHIHSSLARYYSKEVGKHTDLDALDRSHARLLSIFRKRVAERNEIEAQIKMCFTTPSVQHMKRLKDLENIYEAWRSLQDQRKSIVETTQLLEDEDPEIRDLAVTEYRNLLTNYGHFIHHQIPSLLIAQQSRTRGMSVLMEMKSGVGGAESSLFLEELLRMYARLATARNWASKLLTKADRDGGGIKNAILEINGEGSYDLLRWESGVHRVQRVPSTESSGRVHTSTVQAVILPLSADDGHQSESEKLFEEKDVKIEVMRARGAGGQHVNKTESAVRLTHVPTGITVSMQDERSQHTNKARAFKVLHARLLERKLEEDVLERRNVRRQLVQSADRSEKIRTYNFVQDRVTDHRIGMTVKGVAMVLDGTGLEGILDGLSADYQQNLLEDLDESFIQDI